MIETIQKQSQVTILPAFCVDRKRRLQETDLNEVLKTVESVLPEYANKDIDVTITLLEKNLKIMADTALITVALTRLIETAMEAMPDGGKFSLNVNQVSFEIESLLNGDTPIMGACAFVSLPDTDVSIDEKIKERISEPFFTTKKDGKGPGLPIAYRIIKHQRRVKVDNRVGWGTEANLYLPLTKPEMVSMMSIPFGPSCGRIH